MKNGKFAELFLIWLLLIGGNYILYTLALPVRIAHQSLVTLMLLYWLWRRGLPQTPMLLPALAVAGAAGISALFSVDPRMAFENAWGWFIHALLFLWLIDQVRLDHGQRLIRAALLAGALVAAVGMAEFALTAERPGSLFGLVNLAGGFVAALVVPSLISRNRILTVGLIGFVLLNQGRGPIIALGAALIVYALLERLLTRRLVLLGAAGGALALAVVLLISGQAARQAGDAYRADLWRAALAMNADHTLTGVGPGLFGAAYRTYRERPEDYATGAHNLILNTFAEQGVIGALASLTLALVFFAHLPAQRTKLQNAALAGLCGIGAHMLFDYFPTTNYAALTALFAALCIAPVEQPLTLLPRVLARPVGAALACFGIWLSVLAVAQTNYEISLQTNDVNHARAALAIDPDLKLYALQVERLTAGNLRRLDASLTDSTNTSVYALVSYGRYWE